jgi:homoserine dehydrogenase
MLPTASAVMGDLIDVVAGRARLTCQTLGLWSSDAPAPKLTPPTAVRRRYYLRFTIADRPGVLAQIAQVLGIHGISIASVIQHDPGEDEGSPVPLVIMTHAAVEAALSEALVEIDRLEGVRAATVRIGVEE